MSRLKHLRELRAYIKARGIEVTDERCRKHLVLSVVNRHGVESRITLPLSPSCRRGQINLLKQIDALATRSAGEAQHDPAGHASSGIR